MQAAKLTKLDMAKKMATSRSQLDRVLDPSNVSVQLDTLIKAARVNKEFATEFRVRCRDGSSRVLATRGKAFFNGGSYRLMGVLIDVTSARALEAA